MKFVSFTTDHCHAKVIIALETNCQEMNLHFFVRASSLFL